MCGKNMIFPVWQRTDMKKEETKRKKKSENRSASSFEYIIFLSKREDKL